MDANRKIEHLARADREAGVNARPTPLGLLPFLNRLARRWRRVALVAAISLATGFLYVATTPSQYSATALILIDTRRSSVSRENPSMADSGIVSANIESQVELLRSDRIIRKVVESEKLVDSPALKSNIISRTLSSLRSALPDPNAETTSDTMPPLVSRAISMFTAGVLGRDAQGNEEMKLVAATRALKARTSAKRVNVTFLIEIAVAFPDRIGAANLANAYARAYINEQGLMREEFESRTADILRKRTEELRTQAQSAEQALEEFKFAGSQGESSATARVTLKNLESVAQTYRTVHDKFLERYAETFQQVNSSMPEAQLVSVAHPPPSKSWPKPSVILPASLFIGSLLGTLWVLLLESKDLNARRDLDSRT